MIVCTWHESTGYYLKRFSGPGAAKKMKRSGFKFPY